MQGWVDLVGLLLYTRWYIRPKTVTHPSTNRARRALTSFVQRTPLTTTPRRQPCDRRTHRQYCCIRTKIAFWAASICRVVRCGLLLSMFRGLCVCLFVTTVKSDRIGWTGWRAVWVADSGRTKEPCVSLGGPRSPGEGGIFWRGHISTQFKCVEYSNIFSTLFNKWLQRCDLWLSILQQLFSLKSE